MRSTLVLINEKSGAVSTLGVKSCLRALSENLSGEFDIAIARGDPAILFEKARDAVKSGGAKQIALLGGDGTAAGVAGVLAGSDIRLMPLPGGTMNAFARDLGYDADLLSAIAQLAGAMPRVIDVAFVGDFAFLNNIVFGTYTSVAESRERLRTVDTISEKVEAVTEIIGAIAHADTERYYLSVDDENKVVVSNTLMISNNIYSGAEELRPTRTRLDSGVLGLYIAQSTSGLDFLSLLLDAVTGSMSQSNLLDVSRVKRCRVDCDASLLAITVDGEAIEISSPVDISIRPQSLTVLAPA